MHFYCICGKRITDQTDFLSYKAHVLPDQDYEDFWNGIDQLVDDETMNHREKENIRFSCSSMGRYMYQCPECGRVILEDIEDNSKLHFFKPESAVVSKKLLVSEKGKQWKGLLHAEWNDEKPDWREHKGYIMPGCNLEYDNTEFDDKESFMERYYEIFEDMVSKGIIRSAMMRVNNERIHIWRSDEN
ncbi:MAG: hypothetical protein J6K58_13730 [Lachnospiraceae bacterium]|nr:hypothetical protein [Lachnospiraceae bacterium]